MALRVTPFDATKLPLPDSFSCGSDPFGSVATSWVKCLNPDDSAVQSIRDRPGTSVFLYYDNTDLIGFGSIGVTSRTIRHQVETWSIIPHVGIDVRFHGKPQGVPSEQRYSALIMSDLIARAQALGNRWLMLYVRDDNLRAQSLYSRLGFKHLSDLSKPRENRPMAMELT